MLLVASIYKIFVIRIMVYNMVLKTGTKTYRVNCITIQRQVV